MALRKIPKNKPDVKFLDNETFEVICTYNQCYKKFDPSSDWAIWTPEWKDFSPTKFEYFFHECKECGRRQQNKEDKTKSLESYQSKMFVKSELTEDEWKKVESMRRDIINKKLKKHSLQSDYLSHKVQQEGDRKPSKSMKDLDIDQVFSELKEKIRLGNI